MNRFPSLSSFVDKEAVIEKTNLTFVITVEKVMYVTNLSLVFLISELLIGNRLMV